MADEYVKKEVFDARMDRMEALLEKTLIEMKADNEKLRSEVNTAIVGMRSDNEKLRSELKAEILEVKGNINVLSTRMDGMDARIGDLQTVVILGFAIIGFVLAFATVAPTILESIKKFRKPQFTMEDVENAIKKATGLQKSQ